MTTSENGAREIALPSVTELVLSSGITVWVRPMTINDQRLVHEEMAKRFPLPSEADYKIPVPEDQASIPGQTMTNTEAYNQAMGLVGLERRAFFLRANILTCLDFPEGVDTIIERYLPEINRKRKFLSLPEDDLEAVLFHSVIKTPDDEKLISAAITQTLPVEMSEVVSQLRIFRPAANGRGVTDSVPQRRKTASRAKLDAGESRLAHNDPVL